MYLCVFQFYSCDWFLVSYHCGQRRCLIRFQYFYIYWNLCPNMWPILENVLCAFEKNVYSALGWNALKISVKSIWSSVSFKATVDFLVDFLLGRSIHWNQWGVKILNYDCIYVYLSLYVHQDFLYIFKCSYVGCINVY